MKLSACMIVKDEEKVIERCLDSIIDHVDEIIVIDTGSTDKTQDILADYAEAYPDTLAWTHWEWDGSFASMRNKSMDLASGDALFIIDADEYIENPAGWKDVRQAIAMPDFVCAMLPVLNVTAQGPVRGERVLQPRVFLNRPEIRYKYAIHNQIDDAYLAYAKQHHAETGRQAEIVGCSLEIIHTGYQLTIEEAEAKYTHRAQLCREQVTQAVKTGSKRDEAYYRFQLALFLTMLGGLDEALDLWDEIDYEHLNVYNRWYAKYIASRAYLKKATEDESLLADERLALLRRSIGHASGMFGAMWAPQTGYQALAEEPASWMIAGVIMLELAHLTDDDRMRREALVHMIDGFLRALTPPKGARCVINLPMLYDDIKRQFDEGTIEREMLETTDLRKGAANLRAIQRTLVPFDETLLELECREYA